MVAQWQNFKYLMLIWEPPHNVLQGNNSQLSPTQWILQKVVKSQALLKESHSFLVEAVTICLTQPVSNAVVKRGASAIKRVKTRLQNHLKNDMLFACLQVSINGEWGIWGTVNGGCTNMEKCPEEKPHTTYLFGFGCWNVIVTPVLYHLYSLWQ